MVAGSDTSTTLAAFIFYVSRKPAVYEKVMEEAKDILHSRRNTTRARA
jgi:cytochrome P450